MTLEEHPDDTNRVTNTNSSSLAAARAASTICLLAGIWFFVSPWVYGAYMSPTAWNSWIVGALMFIFGGSRVARAAYSNALSWCNMVLGIWAFFSPWIYGYAATNTGRLINSLCVGVVVFICAIISARSSWHRNPVSVDRPFGSGSHPSAPVH